MTKSYQAMFKCLAAALMLAFAVGCKPPADDTNVDVDLSVDTGVPEAAGSNTTESAETPGDNTTGSSETPDSGETPDAGEAAAPADTKEAAETAEESKG